MMPLVMIASLTSFVISIQAHIFDLLWSYGYRNINHLTPEKENTGQHTFSFILC